MKYYFVKHGAPVWINIPGTPFTLPGFPARHERLPGMSEWAPREVVEQVGKGIQEGQSTEEMTEQAAGRGLPTNVGTGAIAGTTAGLLGGRLLGGEAAARPFKDILKKGLSRETLRGLRNIPHASKLAPLVGLGAGLAGGAGLWASGREGRRQESKEVAKGLLAEKVLQQHSLGQAREAVRQPAQQFAQQPSALRGLSFQTASAPNTISTPSANTGE